MSLPLLHSPADIASRLLVQLGGATDPENDPLQAWPAFVGVEPSSPDNCITVYNTAWQDDGRSMIDGEDFHHFGLQFRVRGTTQPIAFAKADAIHTLMTEGCYNRIVNISDSAGEASYFIQCFAKQNVLSIGQETPKTKRNILTINSLMTIRRIANIPSQQKWGSAHVTWGSAHSTWGS